MRGISLGFELQGISAPEGIAQQSAMDSPRSIYPEGHVEKRIRKIETTTTQAVDVEQLARGIRASIGYENISMHAIMTNLHEVLAWMSRLENIVHINRAVRETTGEATDETGDTEEPPPKRARGYLDA